MDEEITLEERINEFQDVFHPLHMYSRLIDAGLPQENARKICIDYEQVVYNQIRSMFKYIMNQYESRKID